MTDIITTTENLTAKLERLIGHMRRIQARMDELTNAGMTTSKPVYRNGKYLTLVSPMIGGARSRQYIGSDPAKIAEAMAMIDRQQEYNNLQTALADLNSNLTYIQSNLEDHIKTAQRLDKKHATSGIPPKRT
jgi:prefoldin subunit 5